MKRVAIVALTITLGGCMAQRMNDGLQSLVGHDIHDAIARIGYPDGQRQIMGDMIYVWGSSQNAVMPMTTTNYTTGMVGTTPMYGTATSTNFVPVNFNCSIQLATGQNGIIKNWQWSGNMGGCSRYAKGLSR